MPRKQVNLRLDDELLERVDAVAGPRRREEWIRQALADALSKPRSVSAVAVPERAFATGHRDGCRCLNCERALGRVA